MRTKSTTLPYLPQNLVTVHSHGQQSEIFRKTKYSCPVVLQDGSDSSSEGLQNQTPRVQRVKFSWGRELSQPTVVSAARDEIQQEAVQGFWAQPTH